MEQEQVWKLRSLLLSMAHLPSRGQPGQNSKLLIGYLVSLGQAEVSWGMVGRDEDDPRTGLEGNLCMYVCMGIHT